MDMPRSFSFGFVLCMYLYSRNKTTNPLPFHSETTIHYVAMLTACFMPGLFVTPRGVPAPAIPVVIFKERVAVFHQDAQCHLHGYLSCCTPANIRAIEKDGLDLSCRGLPRCVTVETLAQCLGDLPGACGIFNTPQLFVTVFLGHLEVLNKQRPVLFVGDTPLARLKTALAHVQSFHDRISPLSGALVQKWMARAGRLKLGDMGVKPRLCSPPSVLEPLHVERGFVAVEARGERAKVRVPDGLKFVFNGTLFAQPVDVSIWACSKGGLVAVVEVEVVVRRFTKATRGLCAHPGDVVGNTSLQTALETHIRDSVMHISPGAPTSLCALRGLDSLAKLMCTHAGPPGLTYAPGSAMGTMLYVCSNPPETLAEHFSGVVVDLCKYWDAPKRQMVVMHIGLLTPRPGHHGDRAIAVATPTSSERRSWTRSRCNNLPGLVATARRISASWDDACHLCGTPLSTHQESTNPVLIIGQGFDTFRTALHDTPSSLSKYNAERAALCARRPWFTPVAIKGCSSDPPVFTSTAFQSLVDTLDTHPTPFPLFVHAHCKLALARRCSSFLLTD
jgi:hypothetical protein